MYPICMCRRVWLLLVQPSNFMSNFGGIGSPSRFSSSLIHDIFYRCFKEVVPHVLCAQRHLVRTPVKFVVFCLRPLPMLGYFLLRPC